MRILMIMLTAACTVIVSHSASAEEAGDKIISFISSTGTIPLYDSNGKKKGSVTVDKINLPSVILGIAKGGNIYRIDYGDGDTWVRKLHVKTDQSAKVSPDATCRLAGKGKAKDNTGLVVRGLNDGCKN